MSRQKMMKALATAHGIRTYTVNLFGYKTASSRKASVIYDKGPGDYPLIGYIQDELGQYIPLSWREDGSCLDPAHNLTDDWPREVNVDIYIGLQNDGSVILSYNPLKPQDFKGIKRLRATIAEGDKIA